MAIPSSTSNHLICYGTLAEWLTRCPAKAIPSGACVRITQVSINQFFCFSFCHSPVSISSPQRTHQSLATESVCQSGGEVLSLCAKVYRGLYGGVSDFCMSKSIFYQQDIWYDSEDGSSISLSRDLGSGNTSSFGMSST
jgi:hypothetical protein